VLWKSADVTETPRLESQELNLSSIGPLLPKSLVSVLPKARLFRRRPTEESVVPISPSMSKSTPLLYEVLL